MPAAAAPAPRRSLRVHKKSQVSKLVNRELGGVCQDNMAISKQRRAVAAMINVKQQQDHAQTFAKAAAKAAAQLAERLQCKSPHRPALREAARVNVLRSIALRRSDVEKVMGQESVRKVAPKLNADCVFINLTARVDRLRSMEFQLARAGIQGKRLEACTGDTADSRVVTRWWDSSLNCQYDTRTLPAKLLMSPGERGCAMSHAVIWHTCAARSDDGKPMIVFEDDAELCTGFRDRCARHIANIEKAIPDPRQRTCLFYLGGDVIEKRDPKYALNVGKGLKEVQYIYQTSSYVIWPAAARVLLTCLPIDGPVDCYLSRLFLERKLRAFYARPRLAVQAQPYENGNIDHTNVYVWENSEDEDEGEW